MNKILCASQNTEAKTLPADICILGHFGWLFTQLTADLIPKWSGGSMFHSLSHIYAKIPFCCIETVANNALNHQHIVVFDWLWTNTAPTLNTTFSLTNVHAKWWLNCLLLSSNSLLSHTTLIYNWPKQDCRDFWCFPGHLPNFGNLSIQHHLCLYNWV